METKYLLLLFCFWLMTATTTNTVAQSAERCGYEMAKREMAQKYPSYSIAAQQTFEQARLYAEQRRNLQNDDENPTIFKIPVVFHIVYADDDENLSDALVQSQMEVLNEDFRRLNSNASDVREIFADLATDPKIEFYIAETDPNGQPTNGITRTPTTITSFAGIADHVKASDTGGIEAWDTEQYLNIWVCNMNTTLFGVEVPSVLGIAYPPIDAPNWSDGAIPDNIADVDGVIINYQTFGRNNPQAGVLTGTADEGRTAVHEIGHYLGLRHLWGDPDSFTNGCTVDDGLEDTPNMLNSFVLQDTIVPCENLFEKNTCGMGESGDLPDMVENYMDYTFQSCQNMFTQQQVELMCSMLATSRAGLLQEIAADFTVNNTTIYPNDSVQFTAETVNALTYAWDFGDGNSSSLYNPTHAYATSGFYTVSLTVSNPNTSIITEKMDYIEVLVSTDLPTALSHDFEVFPIPTADGFLYVKSPLPIGDLTLYDVSGHLVYRADAVALAEMRLDVGQLGDGLYFLCVEGEFGRFWRKVLVE